MLKTNKRIKRQKYLDGFINRYGMTQRAVDEFRKVFRSHPSRMELVNHGWFPSNRSEDHLYFAHCDGYIKIGRSQEPMSRISGMRVGSPHEIQLVTWLEYAGDLENILHERYAESRHRGEWFRVTQPLIDEMMDYIHINLRIYGDARSEVAQLSKI
jgi:hypothetical protein